ncbi:MAG: hypothetical protein KBS83_05465, partial [Lachnospiraceae bacterium]|nr:hypothetical protein [Candidatus Equihabitans merdae]
NIADRKAYAIGLVCITGLGDWPFLAPLFVWAFRNAYLEVDEKMRRQKTIKAYGAAMALFVVYEIILNVMDEPLDVMLAEMVGGLVMIALSGVCIICLYKGRRRGGSSFFSKWFFYGFYPLHLLILGIIRLVRL